MKKSKTLSIFGWVVFVLAFAQIGSAQTPNSCAAPGNLVVSDGNNPVAQQLDIESVSVAEPFFGDGSQKLVFSLKIGNLTPLPVASWNVFFTGPDNVTRFVQMSTLLGNPQFTHGTVTSLLGIPVFNYAGNINGTFSNDGSIVFYLDKNLAGGVSNGQSISLSGRTYIKPVLDLIEVDNTSVGNYTLSGNSNCQPYKYQPWGMNGDVPVADNYVRNENQDFAVWRPSSGVWYVTDSLNGQISSVQFGSGALGDIPAAADYDGDSKADFAVFRPSNNTFYLLKSATNSFEFVSLGTPEDIPLAGDFDGDRVDDLAVFRPADARWIIRQSLDSTLRAFNYGTSEDRPAVGDYDGDRKADVAVFRPSSGVWYIQQSGDNSTRAVRFGLGTDTIVPADYDGDKKTDVAVWRPSSGVWYVLNSNTNAATGTGWGVGSDLVQPGDYNGNGRADYAVWRPENGIWYVMFN